ncbi:MAG: hypothetical protein LC635_02515 [Pseudonocardiaceae bacterium]|nr:hypothetical protein [Pseudonocardiaceae bacterium]
MGVPDGANAGQRDDAGDAGTTNTSDATSTTNATGTTGTTDTGEQDPGTPADQVNAEITSAEVGDWWRSLFGSDDAQPHEAGGGGTGGQFMFASLDELNGVIKKWEDEREGILADRDAIADAYYQITEPAGDMMSRGQADASRNSLANMWQHSDAMLRYAENYIAKLNASRDQMAVMEDGARQRMRSVQA